MKHTLYLKEKSKFIEFSKTLPNDDKPAKRMALNDYLDYIFKTGVFDSENTNSKRIEMYNDWLTNLCIKLHP